MDTTELRTFLTVAELGSFSQASARLGVPQPTLSRHVGRLEEDLGGPLFDRHPQGVSLTELGRQLHAQTEGVVRGLDDARDGILAQKSEASGIVRFGIPPSVGRGMAASVVAVFRERCPAAHLHVMEAFSGKLAEWLESGTVDVAILYDERRSPNMSVDPLFSEDLVLVGRPSNLPKADPVSVEEIDPERLIFPSKGEGLRRAIDAAFEASGITLHSSLEIDSIATLKVLVEGENLLTILPLGAAMRELEEGRLGVRRIAGPGSMSALLVVGTALSKPITMPAQELLKIIKEQAALLAFAAADSSSRRS